MTDRSKLIASLDAHAALDAAALECSVGELSTYMAARLIENLDQNLDAALGVVAMLALEQVTPGAAMDWLFKQFPDEYKERSETWLSREWVASVDPHPLQPVANKETENEVSC